MYIDRDRLTSPYSTAAFMSSISTCGLTEANNTFFKNLYGLGPHRCMPENYSGIFIIY